MEKIWKRSDTHVSKNIKFWVAGLVHSGAKYPDMNYVYLG